MSFLSRFRSIDNQKEDVVSDINIRINNIAKYVRKTHAAETDEFRILQENIQKTTEKGSKIHETLVNQGKEKQELEDAKKRDINAVQIISEQEKIIEQREKNSNNLYHRVVEENNFLKELQHLIYESDQTSRQIFGYLQELNQKQTYLSKLDANSIIEVQKLIDSIRSLLQQKMEISKKRLDLTKRFEAIEIKDEELEKQNEKLIEKEEYLGNKVKKEEHKDLKEENEIKKDSSKNDLKIGDIGNLG